MLIAIEIPKCLQNGANSHKPHIGTKEKQISSPSLVKDIKNHDGVSGGPGVGVASIWQHSACVLCWGLVGWFWKWMFTVAQRFSETFKQGIHFCVGRATSLVPLSIFLRFP